MIGCPPRQAPVTQLCESTKPTQSVKQPHGPMDMRLPYRHVTKLLAISLSSALYSCHSASFEVSVNT